MAKKKKKKPESNKCLAKGCRLVRRDGTEFCRKHQNGASTEATADVAPEEGVIRLDNVDALRFGKIDAELRNAVQGQTIIDFKMSELNTMHKQRIKELQANREHLCALVAASKGQYLELVDKLAKKYGIDDPSQMTIDPDNGIVRDLRKQ